MLRIAEAREARGWTQEQLAQAVGTTQQTIQRWESGQTDPQVSRVTEISKALGITMTFLLGIDLDKKDEPPLSPDEQHLIALYRNMDREHRDVLVQTARAFSALSEKDGAAERGAVRVGAVDAVS